MKPIPKQSFGVLLAVFICAAYLFFLIFIVAFPETSMQGVLGVLPLGYLLTFGLISAAVIFTGLYNHKAEERDDIQNNSHEDSHS